MIEAIVLLSVLCVGICWGIMFQKTQDEHMIKSLEIRLAHNKGVIENLTKTLEKKDGK